MSSSPLETYYASLPEPQQSTYLYLRRHLLSDPLVTESFKWRLPFFDYRGRYLCYLYQDKSSPLPYLAFAKGRLMDHPALHFGSRKQIGVLSFDPEQDLPLALIDELITCAKQVYDSSA